MVMLKCWVSTRTAALGVENRVTRKMFFSWTPCSLSTVMAVFTVAPVSVCRQKGDFYEVCEQLYVCVWNIPISHNCNTHLKQVRVEESFCFQCLGGIWHSRLEVPWCLDVF